MLIIKMDLKLPEGTFFVALMKRTASQYSINEDTKRVPLFLHSISSVLVREEVKAGH